MNRSLCVIISTWPAPSAPLGLSLGADEALGRPLSEIVDPACVEEVRSVLREQRWRDANPLSIAARGKRFDGIVHRHQGAAILELERNPETLEERSIHHPFRAGLLRMERASTLDELAAIITQEMRRTTGFERVMFYRFHEDGSGSVDAEAVHEPHLGLRYPASDIPAQARRLYLENWSRTGCDRHASSWAAWRRFRSLRSRTAS